ncbi:MAG TPA: response regulator [Sphingomicrobium sp.]|nr:response regulator [Sphingomicrobium sp.]
MSSRDSSIKARPPAAAEPDLKGRRILVVEDSPVVGPFTADLLEELGCEVVGPAPNMAAARELVEAGEFDAALIDIHIRGERVFPLCEMLEAQGVPFVFTSGYADRQMPEKWEDRPRVQKPYTVDQIEKALRALFE